MAAKCRLPISAPSIKNASVAELEASLLFLTHEEDSFFDRWDYILGTVWSEQELQDLADTAKTAEADSKEKVPRKPMRPGESVRFPMSLLIRPEIIEQLRDRVMPGGKNVTNLDDMGMSHVPKGALSLSDMSKEEFLRHLGAPSAGDDSTGMGSFYDQSQRPSTGGLREGPMRSLSGKR